MTDSNSCPLCKGRKIPGKTLFAIDLGSGVMLMRDVPAEVCDLCGAEWLSDAVAGVLEQAVLSARNSRKIVDISVWSDNRNIAA